MSEKRRDKNGRILNTGESQRPDGRYQYIYKDLNGDRKCVYSWKLEDIDALPQGARACVSLRTLEKEIRRDLEDHIHYQAQGLSVIDLVKRNLKAKGGRPKPWVEVKNKRILKHLEDDPFTNKKIDKLRPSDYKFWLIDLSNRGYGYATIKQMFCMVRSAFNMGVEDDIVRKNPLSFGLNSVISDTTRSRDALTLEEKKRFLEFVQESKYSNWYDDFFILLHTGIRASEFCGLRLEDLDFQNRMISINHQLQYVNGKYYITTPKTEMSNRDLPMNDEVFERCMHLVNNRVPPQEEMNIDGYTHFLVYTNKNNPLRLNTLDARLKIVRDAYNKSHEDQLPHITAHILRHTYCTLCAEAGMNQKHLQYLMGHSSITVTMNVYTHVDIQNVRKSVQDISI